MVELPSPVAPAGLYSAAVRTLTALHVSGQVPWDSGRLRATGRLGDTVTTAAGTDCAWQAALNALASAEATLGDLSAVRSASMRVYLVTTEDFIDHVTVADGASSALFAALGDAGHHSRTTIGVVSLPLGAVVEVELSLDITGAGNQKTYL